jgi:hypothetical protein
MEATSTRRAGLERFTFPNGEKPYFVLDLANDLPASFAGGTMDIDPQKGRITLGGHWGSRYNIRREIHSLDLYAFVVASDQVYGTIKLLHAMTCLMAASRSLANTGFGRGTR